MDAAGTNGRYNREYAMDRLVRIITLSVLVAAGSAGIWFYQDFRQDARQIEELRQEKAKLQEIVQRLTTDHRVAEVLVTDQKEVDGELQTTLLFVEYARDGKTTLPPKSFTIKGKEAHVDALVIKFDGQFVQENDPLRGQSIALFYRIYGEHQPPRQGHRIDEPGRVPEFYRDSDPRVSQFEQELWKNFWKLAEDESYRQQMGVRSAWGESPWGPLEKDKLYTITIDTSGGLTVTSEPLKGIYREALRQRST